MSVVFLDTETTGLDPETERIFEIAIITESATGLENLRSWRLKPPNEVVEAMHPKAHEVNRYLERTSHPYWRWDNSGVALLELKEIIEGAHICGAVPDFDTRFLTAEYKRAGITPPRWHYHLIDVEALAIGYLAAKGHSFELPWDSEDVSRALGVEVEVHRHEAIADALWAKRMYEAVMQGG